MLSLIMRALGNWCTEYGLPMAFPYCHSLNVTQRWTAVQ